LAAAGESGEKAVPFLCPASLTFLSNFCYLTAMTTQPSQGCGSAGMNKAVGGPMGSGQIGVGPERCALLSGGQLDVLRLVNRHLNSKEIGAMLGISNHTVDQRVRGAMQRLQVTRRSEAARLVAAFDQMNGRAPEQGPGARPPYQQLIH
jgi:DNA-binding CsgD family transcriptional regulator